MNPRNIPAGGKDPVTLLRNVGTLENPRWVDENSSDWQIYLHTVAQKSSGGSANAPAVVVPDLNPLIILAAGSALLYFIWKKFINR